MIWVLGAAILVIVGLVYVMRHETDLCAVRPDETKRFRGTGPRS